MSTKLITALCAICVLAPFAAAQTKIDQNIGVETNSAGKVSISSKGRDVRDVLYDLFSQGKRNFVVQGEVHANLYLSLQDVTFDRAFGIVMQLTGLECQAREGVTYIRKQSAGKDANDSWDKSERPATKAAPGPSGAGLAPSGPDLNKKITVKETKIALRDLMHLLSNQTGIDIVVAHDVKDYKLDATLVGKTLKYALDTITKSARLQFYVRDSGDVLVENKA